MTGTHKNRISVTAFNVDPFKGPHIFHKPKSQQAILCPFLLGACELINASVSREKKPRNDYVKMLGATERNRRSDQKAPETCAPLV